MSVSCRFPYKQVNLASMALVWLMGTTCPSLFHQGQKIQHVRQMDAPRTSIVIAQRSSGSWIRVEMWLHARVLVWDFIRMNIAAQNHVGPRRLASPLSIPRYLRRLALPISVMLMKLHRPSSAVQLNNMQSPSALLNQAVMHPYREISGNVLFG